MQQLKLATQGRWREVLLRLGVEDKFLANRHGPCPVCGGKDRFRWDNKGGHGTYICSKCGAGDGMQLAKLWLRASFPEAVRRIEEIVGVKGQLKPDSNKARERSMLRELYGMTRPIERGDLACKYLRSRGIKPRNFPEALRFARSIPDGEGGRSAAMLALIRDPKGYPVSMHKTFLSEEAEKVNRKLMPGKLPEGACVRLGRVRPGVYLGIAEGLETAMSAAKLFQIPVWSALNSAMLKKWSPPCGVTQVCIFGDNDPTFAGQAAAWHLAHRLAIKGIQVEVRIPENHGDWNDLIAVDTVSKTKGA